MIVKTLAFVAGVVALQFLPELPPGYGFATVPVALYSLRWPMARLPALALLGFFWAGFHAGMALDDILERELEGRTVLIEGRIADIPRRASEQDVRFLFRAETSSMEKMSRRRRSTAFSRSPTLLKKQARL